MTFSPNLALPTIYNNNNINNLHWNQAQDRVHARMSNFPVLTAGKSPASWRRFDVTATKTAPTARTNSIVSGTGMWQLEPAC